MYVTFRALLAIIAGAIFPLAFAPIDLTGMAVLSLCGLWLLWEGRSAKEALWLGWLWGVAAFGVGASWVHVAISVFGGAPLWLSVFLTAAFVAILSGYPALLGWGLQKYFQRTSARYFAFVSLWVLSEYLRGHLFSGFPWLFAGYSQTDTVLAYLSPMIGVYGVSMIIACLAIVAIVSAKIFSTHPKLLWKTPSFVGMVLALGLSWIPLASEPSSTQKSHTEQLPESVTVALVQSNLEQQMKWLPNQLESIKTMYRELTMPLLGRADIVIWPEGAIPSFANYLNDYIDEFHQAAKEKNTSLLLSLPVMEQDRRYYNTVFGVGLAQGRYDKRHLVPFGEYVPLESLLRGAFAFFNLPMSGFSAGESPAILTTPKAVIANAICYEIAYPELVRENVAAMKGRAGFLLTVSNDAWFGQSLGPAQHMQIARMRAQENGLWLVRTTVTGMTGVSNTLGQTQASLPSNEQGVLKTSVQLHTSSTLWQRFGLWPVALLVVLLLSVAIGLNRLKK